MFGSIKFPSLSKFLKRQSFIGLALFYYNCSDFPEVLDDVFFLGNFGAKAHAISIICLILRSLTTLLLKGKSVAIS